MDFSLLSGTYLSGDQEVVEGLPDSTAFQENHCAQGLDHGFFHQVWAPQVLTATLSSHHSHMHHVWENQ